VPSLRLDLDFLDTSGYAVLPIESAVVPIDASADQGEERPWEQLHLTQTLDERQAKDGKLILEIKANANGLTPAFEALVDFHPGDFDIAKTDDHGLSIVKFDNEGEGQGILSERTWTLTMKAKQGLEQLPSSFAFAAPKVELAGDEHFRYVDADLATVGPTVELERSYGKTKKTWIWWLAGSVVLLGAGAWAARKLARTETKAEARFRTPASITPFTVLGLLREIEQNNGLAPAAKTELRSEIVRIESHFFGQPDESEPDLEGIATTWVGRAR
jgi:hypothetical protein